MLAGIRDILVSTPQDRQLPSLLGTRSDIGLPFDYATQETPSGLADDFTVGREFVGSDPVARILADNIFYSNGLPSTHSTTASRKKGASVFGYTVNEPHAYWRDRARCSGRALSIEEKPKQPKSKLVRGFARLDTGTQASLAETSHFVQILEQRQGLRIACPQEIALQQGYISLQQFEKIAEKSAKSSYGECLRSAARSFAR